MKKFVGYSSGSLLMLTPFMALAQFGDIDKFIGSLATFINNTLIPILLAVAFLMFLYGVVQFFFLAGKDNAEAQGKGRDLMLYGIIGFVLIVSIWGIVALLAGGFNLQKDKLEVVPEAPTSR